MKKKIALIDILLFMIGGIIDTYQEIKDPFNLFSNYYQDFYGQVPIRWKKDNLRALISYSFKKNYLRKKINKEGEKLILTEKGKDRLKINFPHSYFQKSNWDKKLRLVIFDIQEIKRQKRNFLRKILKKIGFVMIQKSVWLSPYNQFKYLKKWLKENQIKEKILLIETQKINIKNKNSLLEKFWRSDLINPNKA